MKKTVDISAPVMDRVVRFEKDRTKAWLLKFSLIVGGILLVLVGITILAVQEVLERQTLELFTLLREDPEIISEFWQDTVMIVWEELPQRKLFGIAAAVLLFAVFIGLTAKSRARTSRVRRQLANYRRKRYKK